MDSDRTAGRRAELWSTAGLLGVTAVWGAAFVLMKDALATMPVPDLLAERFLLAPAVMLALRPRALRGLGREGWRHGLLIGLILAFSYLTQTYGLQTTPAAVSGFITGMFVVFTPLLGAVLLRRRVAPAAWGATVLALAGLALLSLNGLGGGGVGGGVGGGFAVGTGELLTLVCAVGWAAHITAIGAWGGKHDPYALAVVQLAVVGAVSLLIVVGRDTARLAAAHASTTGSAHAHAPLLTLPANGADWFTLLFTAILCTAAAFLIQTAAQRHLSTTRTAVVLTMEPVFAGLAGVCAGEHLAARGYAGALMVLAAMYVVELAPSRAGRDSYAVTP